MDVLCMYVEVVVTDDIAKFMFLQWYLTKQIVLLFSSYLKPSNPIPTQILEVN